MTKLKKAIFEAALREKEGYRQAVANNRLEDAISAKLLNDCRHYFRRRRIRKLYEI